MKYQVSWIVTFDPETRFTVRSMWAVSFSRTKTLGSWRYCLGMVLVHVRSATWKLTVWPTVSPGTYAILGTKIVTFVTCRSAPLSPLTVT